MKKELKLYNLLFPIWMLWIFPLTWLVILPGNFIIDSLVVLIALKLLKVQDIKKTYKKVILKVWGFGFLSDFIGTVFMLLALLLDNLWDSRSGFGKWWYEHITNAVSYNPFENIWAVLWVTMCVIMSSLFIYIFNYKISLRKLELETSVKKKIALALAIFTAPFLFYMPTEMFWY